MYVEYFTKKALEEISRLAIGKMKFGGTSEDGAYNEGLMAGIEVGLLSIKIVADIVMEDKTLKDMLGEDFLDNLRD